MPPTEPIFRRLNPADAAECATLAGKVGWTHNESLWQHFIGWAGTGAMCLTLDDQIIVTALALTYSPRLAWVGSVITHPDYQGRGYAQLMMKHVMEHLASVQSVMLDASILGAPIYLKMGFRPLYKIEVWNGQAPQPIRTTGVEPLTEAALPQVIQLDAQLQGITRSAVMRDMWRPGHAWITTQNGRVTGYLLAQSDSRGAHFGPWYHPTPEGADQLFQTALAAFPGQEIRVQFPEPNDNARALCERYGLTSSRYCTRMVYGADAPGHMAVQYGIAAFATG